MSTNNNINETVTTETTTAIVLVERAHLPVALSNLSDEQLQVMFNNWADRRAALFAIVWLWKHTQRLRAALILAIVVLIGAFALNNTETGYNFLYDTISASWNHVPPVSPGLSKLAWEREYNVCGIIVSPDMYGLQIVGDENVSQAYMSDRLNEVRINVFGNYLKHIVIPFYGEISYRVSEVRFEGVPGSFRCNSETLAFESATFPEVEAITPVNASRYGEYIPMHWNND